MAVGGPQGHRAAAHLLQPAAHRHRRVLGSRLHYRSNHAEEKVPHTRSKRGRCALLRNGPFSPHFEPQTRVSRLRSPSTARTCAGAAPLREAGSRPAEATFTSRSGG
ncbi:unnamed protein product [Coccothraustes coccothraustes]